MCDILKSVKEQLRNIEHDPIMDKEESNLNDQEADLLNMPVEVFIVLSCQYNFLQVQGSIT